MSDALRRSAERRAAVDEGDDHAKRHRAMLRCRAGECCGHALDMPGNVGVSVMQELVSNDSVERTSLLQVRVNVGGFRPDVDRFRMWLTALLESKP